MGAAELVVLLTVGGALYVALAPLRRVLERWMLRQRRQRPGRVISLVRNNDGVYTTSERRANGDER